MSETSPPSPQDQDQHAAQGHHGAHHQGETVKAYTQRGVSLDPIQRMQRWVERVVIGENLCPFARPSLRRGGFDMQVSDATTLDEAYRDTLTYLTSFLEPQADRLDSGLLVFSRALDDFEEYLDCLSACEEALITLELEGVIQLASFHPRYLFADTDPDDPAHWTNRSPLPGIHMLRESRVSAALDSVPHPELIPERNIAHLRTITPEALKRLFIDL